MAAKAGEIKVGVVGLGSFGSHHARHYAANPLARLVAVVDADPDRACRASEKHGAAALNHHSELIGRVDAVSVAVPTPLHHAVAADLIDAGISVFIEKPIAGDVAAARDLVSRAERHGVVLQVGHIERFSPAFRALQAEVRFPRLIEGVRRAPWTGRAADVDVVLDLMIHDIDLALSIAGAPVVSLAASGVPVVTALNDVAEARLIFANGVVATLAANRVSSAGERLFAVSEAGRRFVADLGAQTLSIVTGEGDSAIVASRALAHADNLAAEIAAFLDSVAGGPGPLVDGKAGLDALEVADMILSSIGGAPASVSRPSKRSS